MRLWDGAGGRCHAMPWRDPQRMGGGPLRHDVMRSLVQCLVSRAPDRPEVLSTVGGEPENAAERPVCFVSV